MAIGRFNITGIGVLALLVAACASEETEVRSTEQMLAAAGFQMVPADTIERHNQLELTPSHQLLTLATPPGSSSPVAHVYADPDVCHCLWVGNPQNYQRFQQLAFQQQLAAERLQAAQLEASGPIDWDLWGPWGPGEVVVVPRHEGSERHEGEEHRPGGQHRR
jgi:hypothetical protein